MHGPPQPPLPVPFSPLPGPEPFRPGASGVPDAPGGSDAAPRFRRLAAWSLDAALLACVAVLLGAMTWGRLHATLVDGLSGSKVLPAAGGLLLSGGDAGRAASDFGVGVWQTIVTHIEQALALLVLVELLYHFALPAWTGRTLGKAAMDIRVGAAGPEAARRRPGAGRAARRAVVSTAAGTGLYAGAWVLLLEGMFFFALVGWLLAVAVFLANSVPTLFGARRRSLADRAGGTVVERARTYRKAVDATRQVQDLGRRAGRRSAGKVREALAGDRAQQAQDVGRRFGERVKDAYPDRAEGRTSVPPEETPHLPPAGPAPALPPPQPLYDPYAPHEYGQHQYQHEQRPAAPPDGTPI